MQQEYVANGTKIGTSTLLCHMNSAHVLNLIVQEDLKVASGALHKIRESIKYVRASKARMIAFRECVLQVRSIDTKALCRNCSRDGMAKNRKKKFEFLSKKEK
ncbi:Zinc finger BED domain-containing protein RICESLEEPER 2, partial [Mucuna pruriens]